MAAFGFRVLASGSRANVTLVVTESSRVLIDCGLSARETARRLVEAGIDPNSIDALVVTHEHSDHVRGIRVFAKQFKLPVYASEDTIGASGELQEVAGDQLRFFSSGEDFGIGNLSFSPFSIPHDAVDPVGFKITGHGKSFVIATDLGHVTQLVRERIAGASALLLEANHDLDLLHNAPYPWELKQRIRGRLGHLSNDAARELLADSVAASGWTPQVVIAGHISENSNEPWRAVAALRDGLSQASAHVEVAASSFGAPTAYYELTQERESRALVNE